MPSIKDALSDYPPLAQLIKQSTEKRTLLNLLLHVLPASLTTEDLSIRDDGHTLTLTAAHGAQAAKLRQLVPTLKNCLSQQGYPFEQIRIVINKRMLHHKQSSSAHFIIDKPVLSSETIKQLKQCADRLQERPKLAKILTRIAEKQHQNR